MSIPTVVTDPAENLRLALVGQVVYIRALPMGGFGVFSADGNLLQTDLHFNCLVQLSYANHLTPMYVQ